MPVSLQQLAVKPVEATVDVDDLPIRVVYNEQVIDQFFSSALAAGSQREAVLEQRLLTGLDSLLARLLLAWDVTDGDGPDAPRVPCSREVFRSLGMSLQSLLFTAIVHHWCDRKEFPEPPAETPAYH